MRIWHHLLLADQSLNLARHAADSFHLAICKGSGTRVRIPSAWHSAILTLSGRLSLDAGLTAWTLSGRQCQVWTDGVLQLSAKGKAGWLCVSAPGALWQSLPGGAIAHVQGLLPRHFHADAGLVRKLIQAVRPPRQGDGPARREKLAQLRAALHARQVVLQEYMLRCSGRTALRRHQTLLRLLRVQHLIRHSIEDRLDLQRLAASASYSPTHLIRVYRNVFGETPSEYASRLRQLRAWELVRNTQLPVSEIALSLGFESESTFCRAFKQAFGLSATKVRKLDPV